jgi:hypothetical protein
MGSDVMAPRHEPGGTAGATIDRVQFRHQPGNSARAGIEVRPDVLSIADEVIE